ncbi:hypothetical protein Tcan_00865, partial [Toxocara canis]
MNDTVQFPANALSRFQHTPSLHKIQDESPELSLCFLGKNRTRGIYHFSIDCGTWGRMERAVKEDKDASFPFSAPLSHRFPHRQRFGIIHKPLCLIILITTNMKNYPMFNCDECKRF